MNVTRPPLGADPARFIGNKNLCATTDEGVLDLLSEVTGVGGFDAVNRSALSFDLGGFVCRVMSLEDVLRSKRALARPKDLVVVRQLEAVDAQRRSKK